MNEQNVMSTHIKEKGKFQNKIYQKSLIMKYSLLEIKFSNKKIVGCIFFFCFHQHFQRFVFHQLMLLPMVLDDSYNIKVRDKI